MFKKVLVPVTLHESVDEIISISQFLNEFGASDFYFLHVNSSGMENEKHMENTMNNYVSQAKSIINHEISWDIIEGHPATEICNTANEKDVDFIYIPSSRKNFLYRALLGSTTQDVVRLTDKPTFVDKSRPHIGKSKKLDTLLYATDFGTAAKRALPYVKGLSYSEAKLILFHVGKRRADPISEKKRLNIVNQKLQELQDELDEYFSTVEFHISIGIPHHAIRSEADKCSANLIILGRFNQTTPENILGSTAENVIGKTKSSLLLIP